MGLDITVFEKVERSPIQEYDDGRIHIDNQFHQNPDIEVGWFDVEGETESFRAGPYSYYNKFRDALCYAMHGISAQEFWLNSNSYIGAPFYGIIDFSDCEGVFGPAACAKLHMDFNMSNRWKFIYYLKHGEPVAKMDPAEATSLLEEIANLAYDDQKDENEFLSLYDDFMSAFQHAAGSGAVRFC